jgi:hypothetical protein
MRKINYYGSLGDFKQSIGMGEPTPPVYPEGFTAGAYVETAIDRRKKLNADPNLYRKAQDYVSAMKEAANVARATGPYPGDVEEAGRVTGKGDAAEEYVKSGRQNVGQGINKRKKINRMK